MKLGRLALGLALSIVGCGGNGTGTGDDDIGPDAPPPDADLFDECTEVSEKAQNTREPADVVFAIDNTPSMHNEIEELRANMNRFSEAVAAEGLDLRIVLVSCLTAECTQHADWFTICIDAPVGSGGCPDSDTNLPGYLHVDSRVESTKALLSVSETVPDWQSMLRDGTDKHVVIISDDTDEWTADQFLTSLAAADARLADVTVHAIFSYTSKEAACAAGDDPCCDFAAPGGEGIPYRELVNMTGGQMGNLCLQDFDPMIDAFAGAVIAESRLSCEWAIPPPPDGETLDPALVNVEFHDGAGDVLHFGKVLDPADCAAVENGWYYDDPTNPAQILVCPQTCEWIQGKEGAEMIIQFGCESELAPVA